MIDEGIQIQSRDTDEMENMYLNFSVGTEVYGVEIRHVLQIIGMQEITEIPEAQMYMKGIINLRGIITPVFCMRQRFGKMEEEYNDRTCIIVVMVGAQQIGLIVDAIQETTTIEPEYISPQPTTGAGGENPYIKGIARLPGDRIVVLIHAQKLFNVDAF
jgi:purine-binding chemotaxis protein CheW